MLSKTGNYIGSVLYLAGKNIKNILVCALLLCLILVTIRINGLIGQTADTMTQVKYMATELKGSAGAGREYLDFQLDLFKTDSYQKSIKAGVDTPAFVNSMIRSINTLTLPRINKNLDSLDSLQGTVRGRTDNLLAEMTRQLKQNGDLAAGILGDIKGITENELKQLVVDLVATGQNVRLFSEDADLNALPAELLKMAQNGAAITGNLEVITTEGITSIKEVNKTLESIAKTAADVQGKVHDVLNPPKPKGFFGKLKYYTLTILRDFGGAALLIVRLMQ